MKYILIALLVVFSPNLASAQKDVFFGDAGMSFARFLPGASLTYNYNLARWFGVGAGCQAYDFHATRTNFQYVPGLFWDIRFNMRPRKKNQYLLFVDLGADIYKRNTNYWSDGNITYYVKDDGGSYTGLGFGYFRSQTSQGWGHYASLKLISNYYEANAYNYGSNTRSVKGMADATLVVSFGYKF